MNFQYLMTLLYIIVFEILIHCDLSYKVTILFSNAIQTSDKLLYNNY